MLKKEKVIVLRTFKHGDSDLILHALGRQGARLGFFAKGGAKSRKRFGGGVLEPTHYVEITYRERAGADGDPLHTLLEAQLLQGFEKLRSSYDRLQAALYFLKISAKLAQAGTVDGREAFDLLGNALRAAETTNQIERLKLHFEIKVLAQQGVLPPFPALETWMRRPLLEHESLTADKADLRQLEWHIRHSLEAYLAGGAAAWT